jgi:hypothetical protein
VKRPADQERLYVDAVLMTYNALPATPERPSRQDRRLARELCHRGVPLRSVRAAFILAVARRSFRSGPPLPPVRTLHYFLPAIHEVLVTSPDQSYVEYLAGKLQPLIADKERLLAAPATSSGHRRHTRHISALSDRR